MRYVVTGNQMKRIDQDTIQRIGIPSLVLMERASLAVAEAAEELAATGRTDIPSCGAAGRLEYAAAPQDGGAAEKNTAAGRQKALLSRQERAGKRILCVCGTGNNGADGIAAGRILHGRGYDVTVLLAGNQEHASPENFTQQQIAAQLGVPVVSASDFIPGDYDVVVDAVFGIGLTRNVEGSYQELLERLSGLDGAAVVAVDIPSGIHSDTGAVMGTALAADVTVTFGYCKNGLALYPGRAYAGEVRIADIGFSEISLERIGWDLKMLEPEDLRNLPVRRPDGNKGTFGKVLVIAGSEGMSGAAYLSALAAYRMGAGLVKVLTVPGNRTILQTQLPEAIVAAYEPEMADADEENFRAEIEKQCDWADAIVLGPGLGRADYVKKLVEIVLSHAYVPIVLDADGLNTVADFPELTRYFTENIIVTPHMGEMARLTGQTVAELKADAVSAARAYSSRTGAVCVMKDAATVTADKDGDTYLNGSGCSAMAKGGSGDVLTGVIGALLAQGMEITMAAAYGVYLHGLAGEYAAGRSNGRSLLAHEIADALAEVLP